MGEGLRDWPDSKDAAGKKKKDRPPSGPVRCHGRPPYRAAVLHGGPGAAGSVRSLAEMAGEWCGTLEPVQTAFHVEDLIEELRHQLELYAGERGEGGPAPSGKFVLIGHSWGAWLAGLFAERYPEWAEKVVLVGCPPLEERYVPQISSRRMANLPPEEAEELADILRRLEGEVPAENPQPGRDILRLGELCGRADNFCWDGPPEEVSVDSEQYESVWAEASALRSCGGLAERFGRIACPVFLIQGTADPHPAAGVTEPLAALGRSPRAFLLDRCGHTPWRERWAEGEFRRILFELLGNFRRCRTNFSAAEGMRRR